MATLKIANVHTLVTVDDDYRILHDVDVLIEGDKIHAIGKNLPTPPDARVLDGRWCAVYPGFVNTHHHFYQTLTRNLPAVQDAKLFDWLLWLYEVWRGLHPEAVRVSTQIALGELLLSGCTTTTDHFYVFPRSAPQEFLDVEIDEARRIGVRFHPTRGSMSLGRSQGGLPPDDVTQSWEAILADCDRLIAKYHDPKPFAMTRLVLAPCSPFSVSRDLMRESAALARSFKGQGVRLHTHLAENDHDIAYSREKFAMTPAEYAESLGWVGPDVWHAHCVKLDTAGIDLFARTGTGVAHCPGSNMRLASGIAPIPAMREAGVPVGIAVDGSASNDSGHLLGETRQAMLLARVGHGPAAMSARQALELATLGGAKVLGRDDIGALAPGMSADVVAFQTGGLDLAGAAVHDTVASLIFCTPQNVRHSIINGKPVVSDGILLPVELQPLIAQHNRLARELVEKSPRPHST